MVQYEEHDRTELYPPYDKLNTEAVVHATKMFEALGIDLNDVHHQLTPHRYVYYLQYLLSDEPLNGREFHLTVFPNDGTIKGMVVLPKIHFWSACSHHTLPFVGTVKIGYIPSKSVIGLSKIPLLVRTIAKGFWTQELLAETIADRLYIELEAIGVGVYIEAVHTCQLLDLGQPPIPVMGYHTLRGVFLAQPTVRDEFVRLISIKE